MAKKFYAVRKGHTEGIFNTWEECKAAVNGFKGAEYKSFGRLEDAKAYLRNENLEEKSLEDTINEAVTGNIVIAYVDGSYNKTASRYGFGCVIITPDKEVIRESGWGDEPDEIAIHNVAGELKGALYAARWTIMKGYKKLEIRHDYEGVAKWAVGAWKANRSITKAYGYEMRKLRSNVEITFKKVHAHTGDPLNDEADKLAKEAAAVKEDPIED